MIWCDNVGSSTSSLLGLSRIVSLRRSKFKQTACEHEAISVWDCERGHGWRGHYILDDSCCTSFILFIFLAFIVFKVDWLSSQGQGLRVRIYILWFCDISVEVEHSKQMLEPPSASTQHCQHGFTRKSEVWDWRTSFVIKNKCPKVFFKCPTASPDASIRKQLQVLYFSFSYWRMKICTPVARRSILWQCNVCHAWCLYSESVWTKGSCWNVETPCSDIRLAEDDTLCCRNFHKSLCSPRATLKAQVEKQD